MVYDGWRYQPIGLGAAAFGSGLFGKRRKAILGQLKSGGFNT